MSYEKLTFAGTPEEVSQQWHEARMKGIGGSDVAAIMGLSRYKSPYTVWAEKRGLFAEDISGKASVRWGNILEPVVREHFAAAHPEFEVNATGAMFVSTDRPWAFANLDGVINDQDGNEYVLEIKTASERMSKDWEDGVPLYYLTQVTHYMSVTGMAGAYVAVLIGGSDYREYFIPRDEDDVKAVDDTVDAFWHLHVESDVPPGIVGSADEASALLSANPKESDELLAVDDESVEMLLEALDIYKARIKEYEAKKRKAENELRKRIGSAKGIDTETHRVVWVRGTSQKLDAKRMQAEIPDTYSKYITEAARDGGLRITKKEG